MSDNVQRYLDLKEKRDDLNAQKIRLDEQYKTKKESLVKIIEKIKKHGIKPNELKDVIAKKETELNDKITKFEDSLEKVSAQISKIQG